MKKTSLIMNKFLKLAFCTIIFSVLISACNKKSGEGNNDPTDNPPIENSGDSLTNEDVVLVYRYVFSKENFTISGGTTDTLNGLVWNYDAFSFLGGYTLGVQIGSKNNPQTTAWNLSSTFPDSTTVLGFSIGLCVASGGNSTCSVTMDEDYSFSQNFSNTGDIDYYGASDLNISTTNFTLTLQATARAIYFNSIEITLKLPTNHNLNIDINGELPPLDPVVPTLAKEYSLSDFSLENYYSTITNQSGNDLKLALRNVISTMTKRSYGDARYILLYSDESIEHNGYDFGLYDGDLIKAEWTNGSTWNREHVWACSQMKLTSQDRPDEDTKNHTSDLHNLRVACGPTNGHHGDLFFDDIDITGLCIFPNIDDGITANIPGNHNVSDADDHRGDIARILFYMWTRYEGLVLDDSMIPTDDLNMGKLSTLIRWHEEDPVDAFELRRNNRIYEYQGNRNPFIDHPEYVNRVFD